MDIPAFDWPVASFPQLKYPLEDNIEYNKQEEAKCLEEVSKILKSVKGIAGMIVEPIQAEGGDNWASPEFFRELRKISSKNDVSFIVDEVQTGVGATGHFWAHDAWNLDQQPDAVTFSKKMQAAGFYHNIDLRPNEGYRNFNTWMGDPIRVLEAGVIIKEVKDKHLVENAKITGNYLKNGLNDLWKKYPSFISNVRGQGTFLALDTPSPSKQGELLTAMRQRGVEATGCGTQSIRFRPSLVFGPKHASIVLNVLDDSVKAVNK